MGILFELITYAIGLAMGFFLGHTAYPKTESISPDGILFLDMADEPPEMYVELHVEPEALALKRRASLLVNPIKK